MRMWKIRKLALIALLVCCGPAAGDSPSRKVDSVVFSNNREIKVISKTHDKTFAVNKRGKILWKINKYVRYGYVSDNGKIFVAQYAGGNLLPLDYDKTLTLFTFYRDGKIFRRITAGDIVSNKGQIERTTSHYNWGDATGFVGPDKFEVKRVDGKVFLFDLVMTGDIRVEPRR